MNDRLAAQKMRFEECLLPAVQLDVGGLRGMRLRLMCWPWTAVRMHMN